MTTDEILALVPVDLSWSYAASVAGDILRIAGCITAAAFTWCTLGRIFGFYHPNQYRFFGYLGYWWAGPYLGLNAIGQWFERRFRMGARATGGFASTRYILTQFYRPGRLYLGRALVFGLPWHVPIGLAQDTHSLICGMAGSAKTVLLGVIFALWIGSIIEVNPKPTLADRFARTGRRKQLRLEPHSPEHSNQFNRYHQMHRDIERDGPGSAARHIARYGKDTIETPAGVKDPVFSNAARAYFNLCTCVMLEHFPLEQQNIRTHRDLITRGLFPEKFDDPIDAVRFTLHDSAQSDAIGGYMARCASTVMKAGPEFLGSILTECATQTDWMDIPEVQAISERSDFDWQEIKNGNIHLSMIAPASAIKKELAPWFRSTLVSAIDCYEATGRCRKKTLFAIDEFQNLGAIETAKIAAPLLRESGVALLPVVHSYQSILDLYGKDGEIFFSQASSVIWLANADTASISYIYRKLGRRTRKERVEGGRLSKEKTRRQLVERDVMSEEQIQRFLGAGNAIVTRPKGRAFMLRPAPYFTELPVWSYAPDPVYGETKTRTLTRKVIAAVKSACGSAECVLDAWTMRQGEAEAIFGLSAPYSRSEINARADLLRGRFQTVLIDRARSILMENAT